MRILVDYVSWEEVARMVVEVAGSAAKVEALRRAIARTWKRVQSSPA